MKYIKCKYCGNYQRPCNYQRHINRHINNPDSFKSYSYKLNHEGLVCQFCNKECKNRNSLCNHERLCKLNPNRQTNPQNNGQFLSNQGWAKGLTKETDKRIAKASEVKRKYYESHSGSFKGKHHTEETKQKISRALLKVDHSNKDRFSHGRKGYYNNIFFMSSYELAYYIYMIDHGYNIERCKQRFKYEFEGKIHYYTPDFIVDKHQVVETKGYERPIDLAKYKAVSNLIVLYTKDLEPIIKWVKNKYKVKNISDLYN